VHPPGQRGLGDRRGATPGDQQGGENPPVDVVQGVAATGDERLLIARHPGQDPGIEQQPRDRDQVTALLLGVEGESNPGFAEDGVGGQADHALHQPAQGDLRLGPLQRRQGQAGHHIPTPPKRDLGGSAPAGVGQLAGDLPEPDHRMVRVQGPASLAGEPVAQPRSVPPGECKRLLIGPVRGQQRMPQQGPHAPPAVLLTLLVQDVGQAGRAHRSAPCAAAWAAGTGSVVSQMVIS
jgi:hypothetical protein